MAKVAAYGQHHLGRNIHNAFDHSNQNHELRYKHVALKPPSDESRSGVRQSRSGQTRPYTILDQFWSSRIVLTTMSDSLQSTADSPVRIARSFSSDGLKLPFDILIELAHHMHDPFSKADLYSLMYTCRTLYEACTAVLLSEKICVGHNILRLALFCRFVLKEQSRALHIRNLQIHPYDTHRFSSDIIARVLDALAVVIHRARNLEVLELNVAENTLWWSPRLGSAISSLTKLKEISFNGIGTRVQVALMRMRSPVVSATLVYADEEKLLDATADTAIVEPDVTKPLQNFQQTLTSLHVTCYNGFDWDFSAGSFPHVKKLEIVSGTSYVILISFMLAFPNVSTFVWRDHRAYNGVDDNRIDESRAASLPHARGRWPALDILNATVFSCYHVGLASRVRQWIVGELDAASIAHFHAVIGLLRPFTIQLSATAALFEDDDAALRLFPTSDVQRLTLNVDLDRGEPTKAQHIMQETLPRSLQSMPLTLLVLTYQHNIPWRSDGQGAVKLITSSALEIDSDEEDADEPFSFVPYEDFTAFDPIRDYLDNTAFITNAYALASCIPTLEHIYLSVELRVPGMQRDITVLTSVLRDEQGSVELKVLSEEKEESRSLLHDSEATAGSC
ncbi:hypothetical protein BXZ70DRAFT_591466 [Cristinia sonorae]|uniref:F-box domain-containing protein n=1 Tax=Cristinia sonorae TaxID=1940300 RepID=A0A8K0UTV3_9AGAR|nr:hypothetical protein BXZ70DRAFT_591466 [Cristinia sonorae]